jgi:hypothetical protein
MDKIKNIITQFNDILGSFLVQVSPIIGSSYKYYFDQLIKINSLEPLQQFILYVLPHKTKILNKDETYFINKSNNKKMSKGNEMILSEIIKFQDIYHKVDDESKSNLWDIIHALLFLCEDYNNLSSN